MSDEPTDHIFSGHEQMDFISPIAFIITIDYLLSVSCLTIPQVIVNTYDVGPGRTTIGANPWYHLQCDSSRDCYADKLRLLPWQLYGGGGAGARQYSFRVEWEIDIRCWRVSNFLPTACCVLPSLGGHVRGLFSDGVLPGGRRGRKDGEEHSTCNVSRSNIKT